RHDRKVMLLSHPIVPILILIALSALRNALTHPPQAAGPALVLQTSAQQYVTLLPKVPSGSPSPWLIYPTGSTIWVAGIATGNPPTSQISAFFIHGTAK